MDNNQKCLSILIAETLNIESKIPIDTVLKKLVQDKNVQRFIEISKKAVEKELITPSEKTEVTDLFKDPKVRAYLKAAEKVGKRIGWIQGGALGSLFGGSISGVSASVLYSGLGVFALALLGAVAGGLTLGYIISKIQGILYRWRTEAAMTRGGLQSGAVISI